MKSLVRYGGAKVNKMKSPELYRQIITLSKSNNTLSHIPMPYINF